MDESDMATHHEMRDTELLIRAVRLNKQEVEATGKCLNCDEPLAQGRRFCDFDCMTDWSKRTGR